MMRKIFFILILIFIPSVTFATAQVPDQIKIGWTSYDLQTNPLEEYLEQINWEPPKEAAIWSSNWRGYIAEWKIKSRKLYLVDMTIAIQSDDPHDDEERVSILSNLFPNKKQVVASWYTGALILPYGKMVSYVHMGYGSTFDKYKIVVIKEGRVKEIMKMDLNEFTVFRDKKFRDFKESDLYKKDYKNLTAGEYEWQPDDAINFLKSYYAEHYLSL